MDVVFVRTTSNNGSVNDILRIAGVGQSKCKVTDQLQPQGSSPVVGWVLGSGPVGQWLLLERQRSLCQA